MFRDISLIHVYNLLTDIHTDQLILGTLSNLCRKYVEISTFWDYTKLMHLFIANINHSLNIKQLHLLVGHYSICLHRREWLYINIVMTRYETIVCQRESCTYFDAEFWEADVLPLPQKIITRCPQFGLRWGEEIVCKLSNLVISRRKGNPKMVLL